MTLRRILPLILWHLGLLAGGRLFADVVTLKDGRQISGSVESGNTQELHIKAGDQSQTIDIHQVQAIQFGVSAPAAATAPPPPKAAAPAPAAPEPAPNSLILKDGTRVAGRWWSLDATDMHFLVDNQLQHYPRPDVSGVTFGDATLPPPPPPPARSTPPVATPAQPHASAAQPERPPTLARSSSTPAPERPTLARPSSAPPPPSRGLSQPEEIGAVYFWNGRDLTPLERNQAAERGRGPTQYWEMPGPQSRVRLKEASGLVFVVRLAKGVDPHSYSLFPLLTVSGSRRTKSQPGRRGGLMTWPFNVETNDESGYITYTFTVRDLPTGEYSFSPSSSNDGYCFGVDPSAPGQ